MPFGGLTVLLGGDFWQILLVVAGEGREVIGVASVSKSYLWRECTVFHLWQNMCIEPNVPPVTLDGKAVSFKDWVLSLGDGLAPTYALDEDIEPCWVEIPKEVHVDYSGDPIKAIVDKIYPDLQHNHGDAEYLRGRAILMPLNEVTSPTGLRIVCANEDETWIGYTKNIVYREIFNDIQY
ncbi:hypothetical protein POM88_041039 [Heracleum sosnowskyi]|uniref:ATP-dependent DNA helicase n=1 Tax=Heracleum sosnowskyi TaxID=360622 RepID=A0AAD8MB01_9APIA|nr:hypothetical protein POM88_041039 [Heracleum sosnowskyi]